MSLPDDDMNVSYLKIYIFEFCVTISLLIEYGGKTKIKVLLLYNLKFNYIKRLITIFQLLLKYENVNSVYLSDS